MVAVPGRNVDDVVDLQYVIGKISVEVLASCYYFQVLTAFRSLRDPTSDTSLFPQIGDAETNCPRMEPSETDEGFM